jgi:hypothetical protein
MALITQMGLPASLAKKLSPPMTEIMDLYVLLPANLQGQYNLTPKQWDTLNDRLKAFGQRSLGPYPYPVAKPRRTDPLKGRCRDLINADGTATEDIVTDETDLTKVVTCGRPNLRGKQSCEWHWLSRQPIAVQVEAADQRAARAQGAEDFVERRVVSADEWPEGERWCSGCQGFVPLFYTRGSRCIAHASAAAHASMIKKVYDFTAEDYSNLLAWQRGRCYICQQVPRKKRLAVDHDHQSGEVRGLLCANDEWGCNRTLARVLNNVGMAERLLAYVQKAPLQRMLAGEPSPAVRTGRRPPAPAQAVSDRFSTFLES